MKTNIETKKEFDAVEFMRSRRTLISQELQGMTFEEEKEYFAQSAKKLKKYSRVGERHEHI